jgi:hypothetical protein
MAKFPKPTAPFRSKSESDIIAAADKVVEHFSAKRQFSYKILEQFSLEVKATQYRFEHENIPPFIYSWTEGTDEHDLRWSGRFFYHSDKSGRNRSLPSESAEIRLLCMKHFAEFLRSVTND